MTPLAGSRWVANGYPVSRVSGQNVPGTLTKKYLVYVDILGFRDLAQSIAARKKVEARTVRNSLIRAIGRTVESLQQQGKVVGKKYGESDDWLLVTDSLEKAFNCLFEVLNHNTGYTDYQRIPLEIALGTGEYDRWARLDGADLIVEDSTIDFLKTNIIGRYHTHYRKLYNHPPNTSFFVVTQSAYDHLEPLDKEMCHLVRNGNDAFFWMPLDLVERRGRVCEFLEKIEQSGHRWYKRVDQLYVAPQEFESIQRNLKRDRIVFITGLPECGKTYTAVRLLWEYYLDGYEPIWVQGADQIQRSEVRRALETLAKETRSKQAIYFEDPFGKTAYEKDEGLERDIGELMHCVKQENDVFVVITSGEEAFKQFLKEKVSEADLRRFEVRLGAKGSSYDYDRRKLIVLNWARENGCTWLQDDASKSAVLQAMRDENVLPTPLSMWHFAFATHSVRSVGELTALIQDKSVETAKVLAKEIGTMSDDKILFLSMLYIPASVCRFVPFMKSVYEQLVQELNLSQAWSFERMIDWFAGDKVSIRLNVAALSHSSYLGALQHVLVQDGFMTRISEKILAPLLCTLAHRKEARWAIAWPVAHYFSKLPTCVKNLLHELFENDETDAVACAVASEFDRLPQDAQRLLLDSTETKAAWALSWIVTRNFSRLPCAREILFRLAEKEETAWSVAWAISNHYHSLPEKVRNRILFKLLKMNSARRGVAWIVTHHYFSLPKRLKNKFYSRAAKDPSIVDVIAWTYVCESYLAQWDRETRVLVGKESRWGMQAEAEMGRRTQAEDWYTLGVYGRLGRRVWNRIATSRFREEDYPELTTITDFSGLPDILETTFKCLTTGDKIEDRDKALFRVCVVWSRSGVSNSIRSMTSWSESADSLTQPTTRVLGIYDRCRFLGLIS